MDEEAISKLFSKLLNAMNQNFVELTASFHDKLNSTIDSVEARYKHDIESRDKIIVELTHKNEIISKERDDLKKKLQSIPEIYFENEVIPEWNEVADGERIREGTSEIDLLVIGDSCVKHIDVNRLNPRGNNKLICKRGGKIGDIRDALMEEVSSAKSVAHCIIHVGSNHAPEDAPHVLSSKLLSFLREARKNMPETALHFSGILPKYGHELLPGINFVNRSISKHQDLIGYSFISHPDFSWNESLICREGVHPSYKGVAQLAMDIRK